MELGERASKGSLLISFLWIEFIKRATGVDPVALLREGGWRIEG